MSHQGWTGELPPGAYGAGEDSGPEAVRRHGPAVAVLFQERHAELVHLASLLLGSRAAAEDVVLSGPVKYSAPGTVPGHLAVRQFTTATGQPVATLYQQATGPTAGWLLSPDSTGRNFLLSGFAVFNGGEGPPRLQNKGFNGLIDRGVLLNLPPSSGELDGQAW